MVSVPDLGTPELQGNGRTHSWLLPRNPEVEDFSKSSSRISSSSKVSLAQERCNCFACSGVKPGDKGMDMRGRRRLNKWFAEFQDSNKVIQTEPSEGAERVRAG